MNLRTLLLWGLTALCPLLNAQNPKWFKKARKAQISIVTYDERGEMLQSGQGFYIDEDGTALSSFDLFKGAARATVVDAAGKPGEVGRILGASSLYNVVKFRVQTDKKVAALQPAALNGTKHEAVYVMPYPTQTSERCTVDTLVNVATFDKDYAYYTLTGAPNEKYANSPLMNEEGEVLGLLQMPAKADEKKTYAISAAFGRSLSIHALSGSNDDLRAIGIQKALPAEEDEANTFIFLNAAQDSALRMSYLDDFIRQFPNSANGYVMKAEALTEQGRYAEADETYRTGQKVCEKTDELHYSLARMLYTLNQQRDYTPYQDWTMDKALAEADEAYAVNPLPLYTVLQGHCLYALKRYDEACAKYLALQQTNMRSPNNFLFAAQCKRMLQADNEEILALHDSAVACFTKPYIKEAAPVLMLRAKARFEAGRWRDGVADLYDYEHLMRNEVNANFYYEREQAEMKCRMFQQALDDIQRARKMAPQEPLFHAEEAAVHLRVGQYKEAVEAAREAVRLDDTFADAHRLLGLCLIENKQKEEGTAHLKKAVELGDTAAQALLDKLAQE